MLPEEINLPAYADVIGSNFEEYTPYNQEQINTIIAESQIPAILAQAPTMLIINDAHRSTPSYKILYAISELGIEIDTIAIATGTHSAPTVEEMKKLLRGLDRKLKSRILIHDCHGEMHELGTSSRGTKFTINPEILNFSQVLAINSVEPHYFAGMTGGIKSVLPGLAGFETVEKNHSWSLDDNSAPTEIENNPVQQDLWEMVDHLNCTIYGIQMVNRHDDIFFLASGLLKEAFRKAVEFSSKVYIRTLEKQYDVILSIVYPPLDRSLYQAQKGIENTRQALKAGGELILLADCHEGVGSNAFFHTISTYENPENVVHSISREKYKFGDHKVLKFATLVQNHTLTLITDLSYKETRKVFAQKIEEEHLDSHLRKLRDEGKSLLVVLDSGVVALSTN